MNLMLHNYTGLNKERVLYGESLGVVWCSLPSLLLQFTIPRIDAEEPQMACFQRNVPSDRENEQAIAILKKGTYLLKYGRRGKPKFYPFRLSSDEKILLWYCGKTEKRLKLSSVSRIIPGQRTAVFRRYPQPEKEYQSFSLIYDGRSIDLVCKDKDEAEVWITTLRMLISQGNSPQLISDSFSPGSGGHRHTSRNSSSNFSFDNSETGHKDQGKAQKATPSYERSSQRLGKVFSEVLSQTAALKAFSLEESAPKPLNLQSEVLDSPPSNSPVVDSFKFSVSSAVSSSSQGYCFEDPNSLCDVFVWGESIGNGLSGGGMRKTGSSSTLSTDSFLPKVLKSHVTLDARDIACGTNHAVLVTKQGQIYSWGEESGGRLGHGICSDIPQPKLVDELCGSSIELADCGEFHTCAVTISGDLYAWGDGTHHLGLLGLGSEASHWKPVRIFGRMEGIHVKNISCGPWHTAVVTLEGKLFTFGDGTFGALGHGDRKSTSVPREVEALKGFRTVRTSCGIWHTAAVVEVTGDTSTSGSSSSGSLFTWGDGEKGKLGHGDKEPRLVPSCVTALETTSFQGVACGHSITVALTASGQVYAMGIADPTFENIVSIPTCIEDGIGKSVVEEVACGFHHIAFLNSKAEVYTWGKGSHGQLGHGDNEDRGTPTLVKALKGKQVKKVVCGSNFTAAICLHKPISSKDNSRCSGCHNPFNYIRKLHNCYNCGSVFCKSCTSKRSLGAAMAPKVSKPFRVCDECYDKLEGVRESAGTPGNPRSSSASLPSSCNDADDKDTSSAKSQRQLLRLDSFDFVRHAKLIRGYSGISHLMTNSSDTKLINGDVDVKCTSDPKILRRLSRFTSFDSFKQEGRQRPKHVASNSHLSSLVRHSVASSLPFSRTASVEMSPSSPRSSPAHSAARTSDYSSLPDLEFHQDGSKKTNQCLNQEIAVLKAQVEDLTRKTRQLEAKLGKTSKKLEDAMLMAQEEAKKNQSSEEVIRSLTMKLKEATKKETDKPIRRRNSF